MNKTRDILIIVIAFLGIIFLSLQFFDRFGTAANKKDDVYNTKINALEIRFTKVEADRDELQKEIAVINAEVKVQDSMRITNDNNIKDAIKKIKKFTPISRSNYLDSVLRAESIRK